MALRLQITYLRRHVATRKNLLCTVQHKDKWIKVQRTNITATIRIIIWVVGTAIGFTPTYISVRYLQAGGSMALLTEIVDPDTTRILGRWRSDTILLYLHTTSNSFTDDLAVRMFQYGNCALIPPAHANVKCQAALTDSCTPDSQGFLGSWYRIVVASEILNYPFIPLYVYS